VRTRRLASRVPAALTLASLFWLASPGGARAAPVTPEASGPAGHDELASIVLACVDRQGKLKSAEIARSSGYPAIDAAALKVARATTFSPGTKNGKPLRKSCVKFKVKFVIRDGEPVPAGPAPQA
jgi:TonB family protein